MATPRKLTGSEKHLLRLIKRDAGQHGWTAVSKILLPIVKQLPRELVRLTDDETEIRLTEKGWQVMSAEDYL